MKLVKGREQGIVRSNHEVAPDHRVLKIEVPRSFGDALPGQFVMVRTPGPDVPLLPRPFSIYSMEDQGETKVMELLYRVVGTGTELLASRKTGDSLDVLGPLGRGFRVDEGLRRLVLLAGGVGLAPLNFLAEYCRKKAGGSDLTIRAYLGARTARLLAGLDRLEAACDRVNVATDDGSRGYHGMVTDRFRADLEEYGDHDAGIFACGPRAMMRTLAELAETAGLRCQVSVEERMACGFGVCRGCAVKIRSVDSPPRYLPACTDGPVFDARDIDWNDS